MSSIYIPTSGTSSSATKDYVDQSIQPLAVQLGTATSNNTASTIVKRDASGFFAINKIRVNYLEPIGNTLDIAKDDTTTVLNLGSGTSVQTINMGNSGAGATTINLGGAGDTVNISGTLNNITTTNTQVADKTLVLNSGGTAATAGTAGIYFEEAGSSANSYVRVSSDRSKMELKAPAGALITLNQSLQTTDDVQFNSVTTSNNVTAKAIMGIGLAAGSFVTPTSQGAGISWNRTLTGQTCFTNQQGNGGGGWEWMNYSKTNVPSANPQMTLDTAGNLAVIGAITSTGIVTSGGLKLPTTGGTASTLNYYEEYSGQMKFNNTVDETPLLNYQIVRIGKQVTFTIKDGVLMTSSSTGEFMTMNTHLIPSRFLPTHTIPFPIIIIKNNTRSVGKVVIDMSDSKLHILGAGTVNFTIGESNGFEPFSITYLI